jgi:hypothetical protein
MHHLMVLHHLVIGSAAALVVRVRLCERSGGDKAGDKSQAADQGTLLQLKVVGHDGARENMLVTMLWELAFLLDRLSGREYKFAAGAVENA